MKTLLKWVLILAVLVLLIGVAVVLLVNPDDYREEISQQASQALGTEVRLDGPLKLSLWPSLGLVTENVQVLQPQGFGDGLWLEAGQVAFSTAVVPLLQGQVQLGEIRLQGVRLRLVRKADGKANWEQLAGKAGKPGNTEATDGVDTDKAPISLKLAGLYLDDVELDYIDQSAKTEQRFRIDQLSLEGLGGQSPARFSMAAEISTPEVFHIRLESRIQPKADFSEIAIQDLQLTLRGDSLPQPLSLKGALQIQPEAGQVDITSLNILDKLQIQGRAGQKLDLQIRADGLDLKPWLRNLPLQEDALAPLEMKLSVQGTPAALAVKLEKLHMEPVRLTGQLQWDGRLKGQLNLAALDLDALLQPASGEQSSAEAPADQPLMQAGQLPNLRADMKITLAGLKVSGLQMQNLQLHVQTRPGQLALQSFTADLYQGKVETTAILKASGKAVSLQTRGQLQGIQAEPLLKDLTGKKLLTGEGGAEWALQTDLSSQQALMEQLNGKAGLRFENGAILGINIAERIRQGWALLKGQPYEAPKTPPKTDFAELRASVQIDNGVADNQDFLLQSPLLRVTGKGQVDLGAQSINYALTPVIVGTLTGQNGESLDQLKGVPIPLKIKGSMASPSIKLDLARAFTEQQKKKLKKKAEKELMNALFGKKKKDKD